MVPVFGQDTKMGDAAEFSSREISGQSLTPFLTPAFGLTMISHLFRRNG